MMPETKLKSKKNTSQAPGGRKSWQDARNQLEGNLRWALDFMDPEEIIEDLARISQEGIERQKTIEGARMLEKYHRETADSINAKLPEGER